MPQELDLALGAPGGSEEFWRSDFRIRRGAPEVLHLVWILIPQELDLALGIPGGFEGLILDPFTIDFDTPGA